MNAKCVWGFIFEFSVLFFPLTNFGARPKNKKEDKKSDGGCFLSCGIPKKLHCSNVATSGPADFFDYYYYYYAEFVEHFTGGANVNFTLRFCQKSQWRIMFMTIASQKRPSKPHETIIIIVIIIRRPCLAIIIIGGKTIAMRLRIFYQ